MSTTSSISLFQAGLTNGSAIWQMEVVRFDNKPPISIREIFRNSLHITKSDKTPLLEDLRSVLEILDPKNIQMENRDEIVQQVVKIVACLNNGKSYASKLWKNGDVRLDDGKLIFSDFLKSILDDAGFESLMQAMPEEHREAVTGCCFEGIPLQAKSLETLLKYCPNMSEEALERIAASREEFCYIVAMWPLFQEVPLTERVSVVTYSLQCFCREQSDSRSKACIIQVITEIDPQDRKKVIQWALCFFYKRILGYDRVAVIKAIAAIPSQDRESVIKLVLKCLHRDMLKEDIITIIKALIPEGRGNIVELSFKCIHDDMLAYEGAQIIETIAAVPFQDRKNVVALSLKCFHKSILRATKVLIIKAIALTPSQDRENVVELSLKYFQNVSGKVRAQIIEAIAAIPSQDRENVLEEVVKFFYIGITELSKVQIIKTISLIGIQDRKNVVQWILQCFYEGMPIDEKMAIMEAIIAIPPQNRKNVMHWSLQSFRNCITGYERVDVIKCIAAVDFQSRRTASTMILQLDRERVFLIQHLAWIENILKV